MTPPRPHRKGPLLRHVDLGIEIHAEWDDGCGWYELIEVGIADPSRRRHIGVAEDLHEAGQEAREYIKELQS